MSQKTMSRKKSAPSSKKSGGAPSPSPSPSLAPSLAALSGPDMELWQQYIADVTPLETPSSLLSTEKMLQDLPALPASSKAPKYRAKALPLAKNDGVTPVVSFSATAEKRTEKRPALLNRRDYQKLGRGKIPLAARLDLHGMTQNQAHEALLNFLQSCHLRNDRHLLIICGKGKRVLQKQLPLWLDTPALRGIISGFHPAHLQHGGEGAYYVTLRKRRIQDR